MIDPAILRAGRLEKKYYIGVPDMEARMALFKLYLEKRPYDFGLDYHQPGIYGPGNGGTPSRRGPNGGVG